MKSFVNTHIFYKKLVTDPSIDTKMSATHLTVSNSINFNKHNKQFLKRRELK